MADFPLVYLFVWLTVSFSVSSAAPDFKWSFHPNGLDPNVGNLTFNCSILAQNQGQTTGNHVTSMSITGKFGSTTTSQALVEANVFTGQAVKVNGATGKSDLTSEPATLTLTWPTTLSSKVGVYTCEVQYISGANVVHTQTKTVNVTQAPQTSFQNVFSLQEMTRRILLLESSHSSLMNELSRTKNQLTQEGNALTVENTQLKTHTSQLQSSLSALIINMAKVQAETATATQKCSTLENMLNDLKNNVTLTPITAQNDLDLIQKALENITRPELLAISQQFFTLNSTLGSLVTSQEAEVKETNKAVRVLNSEITFVWASIQNLNATKCDCNSNNKAHSPTTATIINTNNGGVVTTTTATTNQVPQVQGSGCEKLSADPASSWKHRVIIKSKAGYYVSCDDITDGGRWTVIQRRESSSVGFYQDWQKYRNGFGYVQGDFWLGLEKVHQLVSQGQWEMRFDLELQGTGRYYANYKQMMLSDENDGYRISLDQYSGTAGDAMTFSQNSGVQSHNNMKFSTFDRDNDVSTSANCAADLRSGWWFHDCFQSNLNGQWGSNLNDKVTWYTLNKYQAPITFVEMKIRPVQ